MNEQQSPFELFLKYLENRCTTDETRQLLIYFKKRDGEAQLRALILAEIEKTERSPEVEQTVDPVIGEVRETLLEKIRQKKDEGRQGLFLWPSWIKYAAFWLLAACTTALVVHHFWTDIEDHLHPVKMKMTFAPRGQRKSLTLPDGSKIWLSPSSSLVYPDQFKGNFRVVKLEGEAFFEVAKDKIHPFIIHNGQMSVRVVGTQFLVQGFDHQPAVTVVSGIVKVSAGSGEDSENTVTLQPNFRSVFNPGSGDLITSAYPGAAKLLQRKSGILSYEGTPARDVLADFSRAYNREITFDNNVRECVCYGDFDTNRPIEISLTQLAAAINARLVIKGGRYIIKGGCTER